MVDSTRRTTSRVVRSFLVIGVTLAAAVSNASAAAASITVNPSSASPGQSVTISGTVPNTGSPACPSGDAAELTSTADLFPPDGFGPQLTRDAGGNFTTSYTIPASTPPGSYTIGVRCGGGNVGISATLQVTAGTPSTSATTTTTSSTTTTSRATTTSSTTTTTASAGTVSGSSAAAEKSSNSALPWILVALAVVIVAVIATLVVRRRRARRDEPEATPPSG